MTQYILLDILLALIAVNCVLIGNNWRLHRNLEKAVNGAPWAKKMYEQDRDAMQNRPVPNKLPNS